METIFKWVIVLVAGMVAIAMILFFSENIRDFLSNLFQGNKTKGAILIESSSFSTSQLNTFVKACWDKYHEKLDIKEIVCYVLKGDVAFVDSSYLNADTSKFDNFKNTTIVKSVRGQIVMESLA